MTMKRTTLWSAAALALVAMGACEDTTGPALDQALLLDAAVVAADATIADLGLMGNEFAFGAEGRGVMGGNGPGGNGQMGQAGQPGGKHGIGSELSGTRSHTFYDAAGNVQDAYDELTTDRIEVVVDVEGTVERDKWSAGISRDRTMVITNLVGENTTRTINGSGSEDVSRSRLLDDGEIRSSDMTGSFTYTGLVIPTKDQEVRYPLAGTITRQMNAAIVNGPDGDVAKNVDVVIVFDGSSTAAGTINGETFEIDLTAREGRFPLRRGFGRNFGG